MIYKSMSFVSELLVTTGSQLQRVFSFKETISYNYKKTISTNHGLNSITDLYNITRGQVSKLKNPFMLKVSYSYICT